MLASREEEGEEEEEEEEETEEAEEADGSGGGSAVAFLFLPIVAEMLKGRTIKSFEKVRNEKRDENTKVFFDVEALHSSVVASEAGPPRSL